MDVHFRISSEVVGFRDLFTYCFMNTVNSNILHFLHTVYVYRLYIGEVCNLGWIHCSLELDHFSESVDPVHKTGLNDLFINQNDLLLKFGSLMQ